MDRTLIVGFILGIVLGGATLAVAVEMLAG